MTVSFVEVNINIKKELKKHNDSSFDKYSYCLQNYNIEFKISDNYNKINFDAF